MDKFNRTYLLSIETPTGGTLTIKLPFTIDFDINRNVLSAANTATIRIFNLSEKTRGQIFKDQFDYDTIKKIELKAGYGTSTSLVASQLSTIFKGTIVRAGSFREGSNFITQIDADDGGYAISNGKTNMQFPAGTSTKTVLETLISPTFLPGVTPGSVGTYTDTSKRGSSYSGNTADLIKTISGGGFFIDNGKAHVMKDDECLDGDIKVINSDTGLLGTPIREETYLKFDFLFEPRIIIGQLIRVESTTAKNFNGIGKIVSLKHKGTISEAIAGTAITNIGLFYGLQKPIGKG